jgi:hypothetical protein
MSTLLNVWNNTFDSDRIVARTRLFVPDEGWAV